MPELRNSRKMSGHKDDMQCRLHPMGRLGAEFAPALWVWLRMVLRKPWNRICLALRMALHGGLEASGSVPAMMSGSVPAELMAAGWGSS